MNRFTIKSGKVLGKGEPTEEWAKRKLKKCLPFEEWASLRPRSPEDKKLYKELINQLKGIANGIEK